MINRFYLSLGGNLSPHKSLPATVRLLAQYGKVLKASTVYESPPLGTSDPQPNYLNAAVIVDSELTPLEFQNVAITEIEKELGRVRTEDKFAARTIDIDIMLVNDEILTIEHRPIPSPEIIERDFVAIPLAEIAPDYLHPITKTPLSAIAEKFKSEKTSLIPRPDVKLQSAIS